MTTQADGALPARPGWQSHGARSDAARGRLVWVDALRGLAVLGMAAYHAAWDLYAFRLSAVDPGATPGWIALGRGVATLFLALSGFGLSLAGRQGVTRGRALLRLGRIAAAAGLVSAVTAVLDPEAPIWFGILHCILVTNLIALACRDAPTLILVAIALATGLAPVVLHGVVGVDWAWTGLAETEPKTLDFRPVLPWLAPVLLGMALGRGTSAVRSRIESAEPRAFRLFAWTGRHSLAIYLAHQPLMVAALVIGTGGLPPRDASLDALKQPGQATAFLQQCGFECAAHGGEPSLCTSTCHCVLTAAIHRDQARPSTWQRLFPGPNTAIAAALSACREDGSDAAR